MIDFNRQGFQIQKVLRGFAEISPQGRNTVVKSRKMSYQQELCQIQKDSTLPVKAKCCLFVFVDMYKLRRLYFHL